MALLQYLQLHDFEFFIRNRQNLVPPFMLIWRRRCLRLHRDQDLIVLFMFTFSIGYITALRSLQHIFLGEQLRGLAGLLPSIFKPDSRRRSIDDSSSAVSDLMPNAFPKACVTNYMSIKTIE